ncbi:MAG: hypothetical protein FWF22_02520, partial [Treponema sp.]|nr:hypothetical protein [Treponema sp.]
MFLKLPEFAVILYPFITGKSGKETDLSGENWIELGRVLREIHETTLFFRGYEIDQGYNAGGNCKNRAKVNRTILNYYRYIR